MGDDLVFEGRILNKRGKPHARRCGARTCPCFQEGRIDVADSFLEDELRTAVADALTEKYKMVDDGGHWDDMMKNVAEIFDLALDRLPNE